MAFISLIDSEPKPGPFPAGRRCAHPQCITILNTRHEGDYCYQHEADEPQRELTLMQLMRQAA